MSSPERLVERSAPRRLHAWIRGAGAATAAMMALAFTSVVFAQSPPEPAPKTPPETQPSTPPAPSNPPAAGRTLDDLLGLTPKKDPAAEPPSPGADDGQKDRLDRTLREEELNDTFTQAVESMRLSMERLGVRGDAGVETQRIQEDAVRRLDALIDAAKKQRQRQQQQQQASSKSRNREQQPNQSQDEQQQSDQARANQRPGERPEDAAARREQARRNGRGRDGEPNPPELEEGALNEVMEEGRVEWGNLPPRIREIVQQGRRDRVSSLYLRLTEEYYRRMAEEASK